MATAVATQDERSTYGFMTAYAEGSFELEAHLSALADAGAARVLADGTAAAPRDVAAEVEAAGLDVTGSAIEVTYYLDYPGAGVFPTGGPVLNSVLIDEAEGYAEALADPDYDYVGIGIATQVQSSQDRQVAVSVVFVDTDAIALTGGFPFTIQGSSASEEIFGTDEGERIYATTGVQGVTGNDTVYGGAGDDVIYAGDRDADTLIGGAGDDTYWLTYGTGEADVIVEEADGGIDTIIVEWAFSLEDYAHVENLTALEMIVGNELDNRLAAYVGRSSVFDGLGGDDTMVGSSGDDLFLVRDTGDVVIEYDWIGSYDVVRAYTDYTLGEGQAIEQLELRRVRDADGEVVQDVSATGNEFGNRIIGNDQRNALDGGAGDDELIGLGGTDVLTGGQGADAFRFAEAPGADGPDRITDFESGTDRIWLDAEALGVDLGDRDTARLSSAAFQDIVRRGTEAVDPEDRLLWDAEARTAYADLDGPGGRGPVAFLTFDATGDLPDVTDVWLV